MAMGVARHVEEMDSVVSLIGDTTTIRGLVADAEVAECVPVVAAVALL